MARGSGGLFGKLALLGIGVAIGTAMTQKKADSNGQAQSGDFKENLSKGLDSLNQQTGGMVDKVKPGVSKALDKVKEVIESQQKMMDKEKDMIDEADEAMKESGGGSGGNSGSGSQKSSGSHNSGSGGSSGSSPEKDSSSSQATRSPGVSPDSDQPTAGIYGGSTEYSESLKKNLSDDSSSDKTFDKS